MIWDALVIACGINSPDITTAMRGSLNKCVKELLTVGATPGEIAIRARRYVIAMPQAQLTPPALTKHWATLSNGPTTTTPAPVTKGW